jgi:hypothetical protein
MWRGARDLCITDNLCERNDAQLATIISATRDFDEVGMFIQE